MPTLVEEDDFDRIAQTVYYTEGVRRGQGRGYDEQRPASFGVPVTVQILGPLNQDIQGFYPARIVRRMVEIEGGEVWDDLDFCQVYPCNANGILVVNTRYDGRVTGSRKDYPIIVEAYAPPDGSTGNTQCVKLLSDVSIVCNTDGTISVTKSYIYLRGSFTVSSTPCGTSVGTTVGTPAVTEPGGGVTGATQPTTVDPGGGVGGVAGNGTTTGGFTGGGVGGNGGATPSGAGYYCIPNVGCVYYDSTPPAGTYSSGPWATSVDCSTVCLGLG